MPCKSSDRLWKQTIPTKRMIQHLEENGLIMATIFDIVGESLKKFGVLPFINGSKSRCGNPTTRIYNRAIRDFAGQVVSCYFLPFGWRFDVSLTNQANCQSHSNHFTSVLKQYFHTNDESIKTHSTAFHTWGASGCSVEWLQTIHISCASWSVLLGTRRMCDQNNASRCDAGHTRLWICKITKVSSVIVSNTFICSRVAKFDEQWTSLLMTLMTLCALK